MRLYGRVGQALIEAKRLGVDPFAAIESVLPWDAFASSVSEAHKTGCEEYLHERLSLLEQQLEKVDVPASANELPDASITDVGLKITPLDAAVREAAQHLIDQTAMLLPQVKITELLLDPCT